MINDKLIKVCGMTDGENIRAVEALDIDLMGFIFWAGSKRFVDQKPTYLPTRTKRVGVFVDAEIPQVLSTATDFALDYIQLHGSESPAYIGRLRETLSAQEDQSLSPQIIKALNIAEPSDLEKAMTYEGVVDLLLFDTKGKAVGGNGISFDWEILKSYSGTTPYLLSGGIGPEDVPRLRTFFASEDQEGWKKCIGIDLNSRFERSPAMKDPQSIQQFITQLLQ